MSYARSARSTGVVLQGCRLGYLCAVGQGPQEATARDMETFANSGLRTLCIAYRWLNEEEYLTLSRTYDAATNAIENVEEEVDKANELIKHSFYLGGYGVGRQVAGGQRQGAYDYFAESFEDARRQTDLASVLGPPSSEEERLLPWSAGGVCSWSYKLRVLIPELKQTFLNLGTQCKAVVYSRVSPAQKALMVKDGRMTLSIGDGANDVAMIQEANIGLWDKEPGEAGEGMRIMQGCRRRATIPLRRSRTFQDDSRPT
ncbi:hypothetical protein BDZ89DRAFT_1110843 [Hymenopellis radicata]|nr:hypothetical protein BDZ89DRAFT_1110843 [Hymenopellis radicata]